MVHSDNDEKSLYMPVAAHRRWLSKGVTDTVSWLSQISS